MPPAHSGAGLQNGDRSKRGRTALGTSSGSGGGGGIHADQPRRPATAPASSSAAASAATEYAQSKRSVCDPLHRHHQEHNHFPPPPGRYSHGGAAVGNTSFPKTPWSAAGVPMPIPMPMPMPVAMTVAAPQQQQWSGQGRAPTSADHTSWQAAPHRSSLGASSLFARTNVVPSAEAAPAPAPAPAPARVAVPLPDAAVEGGSYREPIAANAEAAAMREPTVKPSSPDSEDTYTDSWLAGMPWVASSPPDVDGLEVS